jgi:hypothetical protein
MARGRPGRLGGQPTTPTQYAPTLQTCCRSRAGSSTRQYSGGDAVEMQLPAALCDCLSDFWRRLTCGRHFLDRSPSSALCSCSPYSCFSHLSHASRRCRMLAAAPRRSCNCALSCQWFAAGDKATQLSPCACTMQAGQAKV